MPYLNGLRSNFENNIIDVFTEKRPGDIIQTEDWNHLGDGIYELETKVMALMNQEKDFVLTPETSFWFANLPVTFNKAQPDHLSVTGMVTIPPSASVHLGTRRPLGVMSLVKVQVITNNTTTFGNITSAIYIPNGGSIPKPDRNTLPPSLRPGPRKKAPTGSSQDGGTIEDYEPARQIIVGLYFDGKEPPANINDLGIYASVFIMVPQYGS